jgi:uncharacterized membrane protein YqaE (UPF0057 family)
MKTKNLFFAILIIATTVLSSCSVQRRYHRSGLDVSWNNAAFKTDKNNANTDADEAQVLEMAPSTELKSENNAVIAADNTADNLDVNDMASSDHAYVATDFTAPVAVTNNTSAVNDNQKAQAPKNSKMKVKANDSKTQTNEQTVKQQERSKTVKNDKTNKRDTDDTILYVILSFLIPPLAVYLYEGSTWTKRCTTNLILTLLCGFPGVIHALVVILGQK